MKTTIQSIRFDADAKLLSYIEQKVSKLNTFFDSVVDVSVFLRIEKDNENGNKAVEIKLNVPNSTLLAKEQKRSFEEATDACIDKLKLQLQKYKEKVRE
ncbi:MAG: ribosome-associated translation inhibitor RaiA [Bacteroidia bacterium]|nr:ribosome-associated translation inhibitor RaiA [Bacteroidia bacterium]